MNIIKIDSKKTRLISDGGCHYLEPDNSYTAFFASCNRMYYGVKCDIRFTKDRQMVTSRYRDLSKLYKQKIHISLTNYDELKNLSYPDSGLPVLTTLHVFLSLCKKYRKLACIELHPPISNTELDKIIEEIKKFDLIKNAKIITNDLKYIKYIRTLDLNVKLELKTKQFTDKIFYDAIKYHYDITLPMKKISKDLVDMCHDNRIKIGTYDINDPVGVLILSDLNVDYIYTYLLEEYRPN